MELSRYDEDVKYYNNHHGPNIGNNSNREVSQTPVTTHQSPLTTNQKSTTINKTLTSEMIDTYYIWSNDGKLLAEYDQNGACVKDYIYVNNKLLAEYHPQTGKYYYHMQDQINSTRIVTDDDGNLVYSAAHGPYGGIQKEWVNTYDPKQKFSGKERESYSEVDYFGARYYDNHSYRFISVDPVRIKTNLLPGSSENIIVNMPNNNTDAISNPQLWNLYSFCLNNPVTHFDSFGLEIGDLPPPPPGFNPRTWEQSMLENGKIELTDPDGDRWLSHEEDKYHWRHWDKYNKDDKGNWKKNGRWPKNPRKPRPNQKKHMKKNQSWTDPSGDEAPYDIVNYTVGYKYNNSLFMMIMTRAPIRTPSFNPIAIPFFRVPVIIY